MKKRIYTRPALILLCLLLALCLGACGVDSAENDTLVEEFLGYVLEDNYAAAYGMVDVTSNEGEFRDYWRGMQNTVEGAESYEIQQTNWSVNYSDGLTTSNATYMVKFDNGKTALIWVETRDDIEGIARLHFSDVTDFLESTAVTVPVVGGVLAAISLLAMVFAVWMFVDCLRRRLRNKVMWAILICLGTVVTVTVGRTFSLDFNLGLMAIAGSATADPGLLSVVCKITVPLGAILYRCLRKKIEVVPGEPADSAPAEPAEAETNDQV